MLPGPAWITSPNRSWHTDKGWVQLRSSILTGALLPSSAKDRSSPYRQVTRHLQHSSGLITGNTVIGLPSCCWRAEMLILAILASAARNPSLSIGISYAPQCSSIRGRFAFFERFPSLQQWYHLKYYYGIFWLMARTGIGRFCIRKRRMLHVARNCEMPFYGWRLLPSIDTVMPMSIQKFLIKRIVDTRKESHSS